MNTRIPLSLALLTAMLVSWRAEAQVLDGIAAVVGTNIITFAEVREMVLPLERELRRTYSGTELQDKLKSAALDALHRLVERQLIIQEFIGKDYRIPESVIEERLREIIRQDFGGDKQLLIKTITAQGYTMAKYREDIRNKIIIQAMTHKEISGEIIISPAKIEKYYAEHKEDYKAGDQVKLRLLMVKKGTSEDEIAAAKALIEEILAKLKAGGNFGELAEKHSQGSNNKEQQGDWGWIERDTLRKELSDVAFSLKAGEHSGIIETEDGFYILKVEEVKPAHIRPLHEVRDDIEKKLLTAEKQRLQQQWIDRLKAKAFIRYY
jgi:parvulin-like peptidyl-prolyl isomerase